MAKIVHSEAAPAEVTTYSLGNAEPFKLGGRTKSYETTDQALISDAEVHPWLSVERDEAELLQGAYVEQIDPKDDPLSAATSKANDPDEVRKVEEAKAAGDSNPVALDAGEVQTDVVETGGVAETLAADETSKTSEKAGN